MAKGKFKLKLLEKKKEKKKNAPKSMLVDCSDGLLHHNSEDEFQPERMDTSEAPKLAINRIPINQSGVKKKRGQDRRLQRLRKEKAIEKALSMNEKQQAKSQKTQLKSDRVQSLKSLY